MFRLSFALVLLGVLAVINISCFVSSSAAAAANTSRVDQHFAQSLLLEIDEPGEFPFIENISHHFDDIVSIDELKRTELC